MMRVIGIATATALVIVCMLLPFLPGGHDRLAIPMSALAQIVGTGGLLVVPFAALQFVADRSPRLAGWRFASTLLVFIATTIVSVLLFITALIHSGLVLGLLVVVAAGWLARHLVTTLGELRRCAPGRPSVLPSYLTIVPVVVAVFQLVLVNQATEFSRTTAIRNAAPLIAAIEEYHSANGRYPVSLLSVWRDFAPGIVGIERYHYEPHFDAYNLVFEQFTYRFGTREFVVYNPRDEYVVTAHAFDLLGMTPEQLARERQTGHYEEQLAPVPHWKYFRFD